MWLYWKEVERDPELSHNPKLIFSVLTSGLMCVCVCVCVDKGNQNSLFSVSFDTYKKKYVSHKSSKGC